MRLVLVLMCLGGCGSRTPEQPAATPAPAPHAALDAMDTRAPVPLLPMMALHQKEQMRDHLRVVQEVLEALSKEDWQGAETAARRFGSSPSMEQMCTHMGAGAEGFTEQALDFHTRADRIAEAARAKDAAAVLSATAHTVAACTACHDAWRQEVVSSETWSARTGMPAPH